MEVMIEVSEINSNSTSVIYRILRVKLSYLCCAQVRFIIIIIVVCYV